MIRQGCTFWTTSVCCNNHFHRITTAAAWFRMSFISDVPREDNVQIQLVSSLSTEQIRGRRQIKKTGVDTHGERGARAYSGGVGEEPQAESRGIS